jgi:hypothetical protein
MRRGAGEPSFSCSTVACWWLNARLPVCSCAGQCDSRAVADRAASAIYPERTRRGNLSQLSASEVWHANVFNVHSRRNRDSRLTTTPREDVLRVLLGAYDETRHGARGQSALFRGSLGRRNRRAGGHPKRGKPVALMSPYPAEALAAERKAAIDRMIAAMNEPVTLRGGFRTFTRDEMHEC